MCDVRGLTPENRFQLVVGLTNPSPNNVSLILTRELAAGNQEVRSVISRGCSRPIAEPAEPNVKIFLELGGFLFRELIVRNESDMDKA